MPQQSSFLNQVEVYLPELLNLLKESVNIDSPSASKIQNDRMADWYSKLFTGLIGGKVHRIEHPELGDKLVCEFGTGPKHILIVGHYDTVWPLGEASRRPFYIKDQKAYGPGVYDMKAGILQAFFALKVLKDTGRFPEEKKVVILLNSDEELGSPTSRELIETMASQSDLALVLEPPMEPQGALKTVRKGSGRYKLIVKGISAHAGVNPEKGVSAIHELAFQIQKLYALADTAKGTTLNVGIVKGGIGSNVIAEYAEAEIDVRVASAEEAQRVDTQIKAIRPCLNKSELKITGGMIRPPMEKTKESAALFKLAQEIARDEFDFGLEEAATGGVSDGNFTAGMGIPTLDGLGASGDHAHSPLEYVRIDQIQFRTALLARLIENC
ncbi:MAG TPA: M20 family metallopeptidase [Bacillales bacterium]|nr:M20 family metallopeptidase [Bacillales bacterium]